MHIVIPQHCTPQTGAAMSTAQVNEHLAQLSGWALTNGAIEKTFAFNNFFEVMAFVNALAWICHTEDHHPDLAVSYKHCTVRWQTHSVGGVSVNDLVCANQVDALICSQHAADPIQTP
jgi:4a-hydroxytetrahydrobiopterin dehydratase